MKNNLSLILLLFLIDNREQYCMDKAKNTPQITKKNKYEHFYTLTINDGTLIDAFFNNKDYITCISQQGTAYPLNIKTSIPGKPYTISNHFTGKQNITVEKIIYNREKNHLYVISNRYCKKINKKNAPHMQDIAIIDYTQWRDMKPNASIKQFQNEIIHFVDPNMAFVITTPRSYKSLFITHFTNEYTTSFKQYLGETIKSIAVHAKKMLCAVCSSEPDKSPMLRIISTKTGDRLWIIPEWAENLTFSHNGEWIAYSTHQRVRMQKIKTPRTIETIVPIVAKIKALSYSKDGTTLQVVDENPLWSFSVNALTGTRLNRQNPPINPQPKKCFDKNRIFMAMISDHKVDLYQKVDQK